MPYPERLRVEARCISSFHETLTSFAFLLDHQYPTQILIRFDDADPLPDGDVEVMPMSSKTSTVIKFFTPSTDVGVRLVAVSRYT